MGLVNFIFSIETSRIDALLRAVETGLADGSVDPITGHIESMGLAEWAADEIGAIEIVTKKSLFRRARSHVLRPGAGFVIEALLQQLGNDLPAERVCDADKAFQMLQSGEFGVELSDIDGIDDWFAVVHCTIDSPPKHLRTGDAPDYVLVPDKSRPRLADVNAAILARCDGNERYLTEPLRQYETVLRGQEDETVVSILS